MELRLLSDRVRSGPQTGAVIRRDLPESAAAQRLEAEFTEKPVVRAPRGGVASFQIVASTGEPSDGAEVALRAGPFEGEGGALDKADVWYEWPCQIGEDEWTFDGLVPVEIYRDAPAPARAGPLGPRRHHAFWVDVRVPRDARPGTYRGSVQAEGEPGIELSIEVLPLELPVTARVTVDLNSYAKHIPGHFPGIAGNELVACEHSYYREAHDNRALFHYLGYGHSGIVAEGYAPPLAGRGRNLRIADWEAYDRRFGALFDGSAFVGSPGGERPIAHFYLPFNYDWPADFAYFGTRGYALEWAQALAEFRRHIEEKGWTETNFEVFFNPKKRYRFFPWDGDERKHFADREHFLYFRGLIDRAAQMAGEAGTKARVIYRVDISWTFAQDALDDEMGPVFDLWVIYLGNLSWSREAVEALRSRGQIAWSYETEEDSGNPKQTLMDLDRQAITCWRRGADGFLPNWLATGADADLDRANPLAMLYPGERFGFRRALGSIRLRRIRLATETTDLLEMLGERGRALVDEVADAREDDWWLATPAWTLWPTDTMKPEMYGWQPVPNPLGKRDAHAPAMIRERAIDLLIGRQG